MWWYNFRTMADDQEVRQLREIKKELSAIRGNTSTEGWFVRGLLYGAGWIVGSLAAVILIGWLLLGLGIIPGVNIIAAYIGNAMTELHH